jgi:uncharacterized YccA/Bax inhibitor family protein
MLIFISLVIVMSTALEMILGFSECNHSVRKKSREEITWRYPNSYLFLTVF